MMVHVYERAVLIEGSLPCGHDIWVMRVIEVDSTAEERLKRGEAYAARFEAQCPQCTIVDE